MAEFEDSGQWKQGPQTPGARQKASAGPLVHGGRKAEVKFYQGKPFAGPLRAMLDEVLADNPTLQKAIDEGGMLADGALRYAQAEVVRRTWFIALHDAEDFDRAGYLSTHLAKWTNTTHVLWVKLMELFAAQDSVIDYEDWLNEQS